MCKNKRSKANVPNVTSVLNQVGKCRDNCFTVFLNILLLEHSTIKNKNKLFKMCSMNLKGKEIRKITTG